jgi:hypothetical protein
MDEMDEMNEMMEVMEDVCRREKSKRWMKIENERYSP